MNPSFTGLQTILASAVPPSSSGVNSESAQTDSESADGFNGVLAGLFTTPEPVAQGATPTLPDDQALLAAVQDLPQGGKLLPLLQETLEKVAAGGGDLKQLVARLTAGLKQLAQDPGGAPAGQTPAEQLALVLQPLVQEQPGLQTLLPAEIASALERQAVQVDKGVADPLARSPVAPATPQKTADGAPVQGLSGDATAARDSKPFALDLSTFTAQPQQQQSAAGGVRDAAADLTALMSAIRRLTPDNNRPSGADPAVVTPTAATHTPPAATTPSAVPTVSVNTPFGQPDWDQALGERIQWLASQKVQGAQVRLNPANLGPMEVRIQVHNDQATVQFSAHHAVVREALEAALPRLRDMFEASGVQLVDVDVSGGSFGGQQGPMQDMAGTLHRGAGVPGDADITVENAPQTTLAAFMSRGRLDLFA